MPTRWPAVSFAGQSLSYRPGAEPPEPPRVRYRWVVQASGWWVVPLCSGLAVWARWPAVSFALVVAVLSPGGRAPGTPTCPVLVGCSGIRLVGGAPLFGISCLGSLACGQLRFGSRCPIARGPSPRDPHVSGAGGLFRHSVGGWCPFVRD